MAVQRAEKKPWRNQPEGSDRQPSLNGGGRIITRTVYPEVPPRVEYAQSDLGESMRPIIKSMETFGINYKEQFEK